MRKRSVENLLVIIIQISGLYLLNLIGESIASLLKLPLPGSIVGLILLYLCLHFKVIPEKYIKLGAGFLLAILPLFFIPATVGVIQYPEFLSGKGITLVLIVMVSTLLTMFIAGRVSELYEEKKRIREEY